MSHEPEIACRGSVSVHWVETAVSRGNCFGRTAARRRIDQMAARPAKRDSICIPPTIRGFIPIQFGQEILMTDQLERLMSEAGRLGSLGVVARRQGEEAMADAHFRKAFGLAL